MLLGRTQYHTASDRMPLLPGPHRESTPSSFVGEGKGTLHVRVCMYVCIFASDKKSKKTENTGVDAASSFFTSLTTMIDLAAIYFGIFIGVFPLTLVKIVRQSRKIISQAHSRSYQNAYLYMIWIEAIVNFVFAIVTYLYLTEVIPGSTGLYFGTSKMKPYTSTARGRKANLPQFFPPFLYSSSSSLPFLSFLLLTRVPLGASFTNSRALGHPNSASLPNHCQSRQPHHDQQAQSAVVEMVSFRHDWMHQRRRHCDMARRVRSQGNAYAEAPQRRV